MEISGVGAKALRYGQRGKKGGKRPLAFGERREREPFLQLL